MTPDTIAASYARYSSDNQRHESIEDQERKIDKLAADKLGQPVRLRFRDFADSGWNPARSDYQRTLAAAKAGEFQVLLLDDLSRLGRDQDERGLAIRRLEFIGVRVLSADGYDTHMPLQQRVITRGARGMIDSIYSIDLAEKTHRGLAGQVLKGNNAGGRAYGYRHVPITDPTRTDTYGRPVVVAVRREPDPDQAGIVRQIFEQFAAGCSPREIAHRLNAQRIPSPRGSTWAVSAIYGDRRSGVGILNNPIYGGTLIWNRSRWVRDPDTGKRHRRERDRSEWIIQPAPELRIVDPETWAAAEKRLATRRPLKTGRKPSYLLSGILRCGVCGGAYVVVYRGQYGCAAHKDRGPAVCRNGLRVHRAELERQILAAVKETLLSPDAVEAFRAELARELRAARRDDPAKPLRARLDRLEAEIGRMVAAIRAGTASKALTRALEAAETERDQVAADLAAAIAPVPEIIPGAVDEYRKMVESLENGHPADTAATRADLAELLGHIPLTPVPGRQEVEANLEGVYTGLLRIATGGRLQTTVVAGAGFSNSLLFPATGKVV
jgi:DNA invertase Pin-like site-specific DNA recombinase